MLARWFASPAPSALRVSHPLSGLIAMISPGPCGSISRHIRPWGLVTAFRAFPARSAVTPLGARCSLAVSAGSSRSRDLGILRSPDREIGLRPCLGLTLVTLLLRPRHPKSGSPYNPDRVFRHQLGVGPTGVGAGTSERPRPLLRRRARCAQLGAGRSGKGTWSSFGQARACDFRALLRPSVRTRPATVRQPSEPMLS
jgi:hypothetical protein